MGTTLGADYRVLRDLGSGGESRVVAAEHLETGEVVALKVWPGDEARDSVQHLTELRMLLGLSHPGVVAVRDALQDPGTGEAILVMDLVDGPDLLSAFRDADAASRDHLVLGVLDALSYLHRSGVVHGDLKPGNILVRVGAERPVPVIIDFGMAERRGAERFLGGTPAYLAPEVVGGARPSQRSDLYSVGLTLLQVALGLDRPRRTIPRDATLPRALQGILPRLLARDPVRRPVDAGAAWSEAAAAGTGTGVLSLPARLPLVGRDELVSDLGILVDDLAAGRPGAVALAALIGSEGQGRRRLLREAGLRARLAGVAWCSFTEQEPLDVLLPRALRTQARGAMPIAELSLAPDAWSRDAAPLAERGAHLLAAGADPGEPLLLSGSLSPRSEPELVRFLRRVAALERAHRARGASARVLVLVAGDEASCRRVEPDRNWTVPPLGLRELELLLRELFGPELPPSLLAECAGSLHAASGGIAFVVDQVLRHAVASGGIIRQGTDLSINLDRLDFSAPGALQNLVGRRVQALDDRARRLLEALALAHEGRRADELAAVVARDRAEVHEGLRGLRDAGWLEEEMEPGGARFAIAAGEVARAVAADLDEERGRDLHRAWLAVSEDVGTGLEHALRAQDLFWIRSHAEAALRSLALRGATRRALRLAEEVLDAALLEDREAESVALLLARLLAAAGRREEAARRVESLVDAASPETAAAALRILAHLAALRADGDAALRCAEDAVRRAPRGSAERVRSRVMLGQVHLRFGDPDAARVACDRAVEEADPESAEAAVAWNTRGLALLRTGSRADARRDLERGRARFQQLGDDEAAALCGINLGNLLTRMGAFDEARRVLEEAVAVLAARGETASLAQALTNLGILAGEEGRSLEATRCHRESFRLHGDGGDALRRAAARGSEGMALLDGGRPGAARTALRESLAELEMLGQERFALIVAAHLARSEDTLGRRGAARRHAASALRRARRLRSPRESAEALVALAAVRSAASPQRASARAAQAAELAGRASEVALATEATLLEMESLRAAGETDGLAERLEALAGRAPVHEPRRLRLLAEIAEDAPAQGALARGLRRARRGGNLLEEWRLQMEIARRGLAEGRYRRARRSFARALAVGSELEFGMTSKESALFRLSARSEELERMAEAVTARLATLERSGTGRASLEVAEVLDAVTALAAETRMESLLERMLDGLLKLTRAERAFVILRDGPEDLRVAASRDRAGGSVRLPEDHLSSSMIHEVIASGRHLVIADALESDEYKGLLSVAHHRLRSLACVAFSVGDAREGACYLDGGQEVGAFSDDEIPIVAAFAQMCGIAIANLRRRRSEAHQREELSRELRSERTFSLARMRAARAVRGSVAEGGIIGRAPAMQAVLGLLDRAARTDLPVLVTGESGVGKELVARAIHERSPREPEPFIAQNCAAIPETLIESELFGYRRGAFTGAEEDRPGLFALAGRGTLFLDEIADLPLAVQAKLLRVLQEGEVRPLGSAVTEPVQARIVAATNRDLPQQVADGRFREDLYYRLKVIELEVPPLRERREDIPLLIEHFLAASQRGLRLTPRAEKALTRYDWPGNVRQLEHEVQRAMALADGEEIDVDILSPELRGPERSASPFLAADGAPLSLKEIEARAVRAALQHTGNDRTAAARLLGISRSTLYEKLKTLPQA